MTYRVRHSIIDVHAKPRSRMKRNSILISNKLPKMWNSKLDKHPENMRKKKTTLKRASIIQKKKTKRTKNNTCVAYPQTKARQQN